jgi:hypothetical protein
LRSSAHRQIAAGDTKIDVGHHRPVIAGEEPAGLPGEARRGRVAVERGEAADALEPRALGGERLRQGRGKSAEHDGIAGLGTLHRWHRAAKGGDLTISNPHLPVAKPVEDDAVGLLRGEDSSARDRGVDRVVGWLDGMVSPAAGTSMISISPGGVPGLPGSFDAEAGQRTAGHRVYRATHSQTPVPRKLSRCLPFVEDPGNGASPLP